MNTKRLGLYGLQWNPFGTELPAEALRPTPAIDSFAWRIENVHLREGGFALVTGDPGMGKSVALRILAERLGRVRDAAVGALAHPQSNLADFYRELGEIYGVPLKPHNRWGGFKVLRDRWQEHLESALARPVLLVDEAQEMSPVVLSELRLLTSTRLDSRIILAVVLAGDGRLAERMRGPELAALGSRIRIRLSLEAATGEELLALLTHLVTEAGNAHLMTPELMATICDHAAGNLRTLVTMAGERLAAAAPRECKRLDEKLYFDVFAPPGAAKAPVGAAAGRRGGGR